MLVVKPIKPNIWIVGLIFIGTLAMFGGPAAALLALTFLTIYSLIGVNEALFSLLLSCLVSVLNRDLFYMGGTIVAVMRWIVLLTASLSIFIRVFYRRDTILTNASGLLLFLFLLLATVLSNVFGYAPGVSNFKLFIFGFGSLAIIHGLLLVDKWREHDRYVFSVLVGFLTTSTVIWILFPIHAYQRNNDLTSIAGFQGMTNQSQVMGVLAAVSLAWVIAKIATDSDCKRWYWYLVGAGLLIFMIASNARTGPVCLTLAAVTTGVGALFFRRYRIKAILEIFKLRFWVAVTSFVVLIGLNFVKMRDAAVDFAIKGGRNGNEINAAFEASRGFRIRELYNSFLESPWTGKGFGLETFERNLQVVYDPLLGVIPIKASVEKNFIFLAIFEETGIFGGGIIILFIIATVYFLINYRSLLWCFVFLAGIFVNVGEAVLFSLGGMGLFVWVIMMSSLIRRPSGLGTPIQ
jgi:hypothetical protein